MDPLTFAGSAARVVRLAGRELRVRSLGSGGGRPVVQVVSEDGSCRRFEIVLASDGRLLLDERPLEYAWMRGRQGEYVIAAAGERWLVEVLSEGEAALASPEAGGARLRGVLTVRAPMPGRVLAVEAVEGDRVEEGEGLVILEAMKMENEVRAPRGGVVRAVLVEEGDTVEQDQELCVLDPGDTRR